MRIQIAVVWTLWSCLSLIGPDVAAQSSQPINGAETKHSEMAQVEFAKKIEKLIDQLASNSAKPVQGSNRRAPREAEIWAAVDELHGCGTAAFPYLIAHFDDERFSYSEESPATTRVYQASVGRLCGKIVERQINKYVPWKLPDPRGTPGYGMAIVPQDKAQALEWWKANQNRKLWELQADSVRVVLDENRKRQLTEGDETRKRHAADAIQANEELLARLLQTEVPLPTKPFRPYASR